MRRLHLSLPHSFLIGGGNQLPARAPHLLPRRLSFHIAAPSSPVVLLCLLPYSLTPAAPPSALPSVSRICRPADAVAGKDRIFEVVVLVTAQPALLLPLIFLILTFFLSHLFLCCNKKFTKSVTAIVLKIEDSVNDFSMHKYWIFSEKPPFHCANFLSNNVCPFFLPMSDFPAENSATWLAKKLVFYILIDIIKARKNSHIWCIY